MIFLDGPQILNLINRITLEEFTKQAIDYLEEDFKHWEQFQKVARYAAYVNAGVIELMPIWNDSYYAYKYVNGHPENPKEGRQTVIGFGQLSEVRTGYPILIADMTLLTAIRTACVSAIATRLMAKDLVKGLSFIGLGSQSEFQALAHLWVCPDCDTVQYYDINPDATRKFERNIQAFSKKSSRLQQVRWVRCSSIEEAIQSMDCITTATAAYGHAQILNSAMIQPGVHINGIGGDSVGKTELDIQILRRAKVVVEYFEQSYKEGEIQQLSIHEAKKAVFAELYELVRGDKKVRNDVQDITLFDSVGFAMEDFSLLRLVYALSKKKK